MTEQGGDFDFLQTPDEVDGMLGEKVQQLREAKSGTDRHEIRVEIDELLERRTALGRIALDGGHEQAS